MGLIARDVQKIFPHLVSLNKDPDTVPIFGGFSYTSDHMWYPSDNFHAELGVLTGAYNYTRDATEWGPAAFRTIGKGAQAGCRSS